MNRSLLPEKGQRVVEPGAIPSLRHGRRPLSQEAMARTHLDRKNVALGALIYRLRQAIDVFRIIGLNTAAAKRLGGHKISGSFFGYVQLLALESIAVTICKIFDYENPKKPYRVNSIDGILARVAKHKFTAVQLKHVERFGHAYGHTGTCTDAHQFLRDTVGAFRKKHPLTLKRLRDFRNQQAAHSQLGAKFKNLPSIDEFELIFDFAADFYRLISGGILDIGPASFAPHAGTGLLNTFKNLGLADAKFDFPRQP